MEWKADISGVYNDVLGRNGTYPDQGEIFLDYKSHMHTQVSRVNKRLHLVFPISPLSPYGSTSNLVSPESFHRGESNRYTLITRVQDFTK